MESWHTPSVKARESALISRRFVVAHMFPLGAVLKLVSSGLETGVSGIIWSYLSEVKPLSCMMSTWHGSEANARESVFISC